MTAEPAVYATPKARSKVRPRVEISKRLDVPKDESKSKIGIAKVYFLTGTR